MHLPLFNNVITGRLSVYVALLTAVTVALWAAAPGRPRSVTVALVALATLAIVPNLRLGVWHSTPEQPRLFATGLYRACLGAGENASSLSRQPATPVCCGKQRTAPNGSWTGAERPGARAPARPRSVALALVNNKIPRGGRRQS